MTDSPLPGILIQIAELNEKIEELQDSREALADPLEAAATKYHKSSRVQGILHCTRCYFVFVGTKEDRTVAVFSTGCSWCGPGPVSLKVPVNELAKFLD